LRATARREGGGGCIGGSGDGREAERAARAGVARVDAVWHGCGCGGDGGGSGKSGSDGGRGDGGGEVGDGDDGCGAAAGT
jgi:hypothetical protein